MRAETVYLLLLIILFMTLNCPESTIAQERPRTVRAADPRSSTNTTPQPDDIVRIRTRVVFIDALVKDQKTNEPVRNLNRQDFQVLDDGQPRSLSYFTRQDDSRRPLALLLFIDLWTQYGQSLLKSDTVMHRLASALTKLAPEDEVGVMVTWIEESPELGTPLPTTRLIADFTPERAKTTEALRSIPQLIMEQEKLMEDLAEKSSREVGDLRLDLIWRLSDVAGKIIPLSARFPKSQLVVVGLIDDLFDLRKGEREAAVAEALRANVVFYGLIFNKSFATRLFIGAVNKIFMGPRRLSVHAADYLAKETGGAVVGVGRPNDLATGLEGFVMDLMARYNLGFSLDDREPDDNRMHRLVVRTKAVDARGKRRNLLVRSRRGYYMPKAEKTRVVNQ